jgi:hypothetical protein
MPILGGVGFGNSDNLFRQKSADLSDFADRRHDSKGYFFIFYTIGDRRAPIAER